MDQPLPPVSPPLSRELLAQRIRQALADNTSQFITPEDIRSRLLELVNSVLLQSDPFSGGTNFQPGRLIAYSRDSQLVSAVVITPAAVPILRLEQLGSEYQVRTRWPHGYATGDQATVRADGWSGVDYMRHPVNDGPVSPGVGTTGPTFGGGKWALTVRDETAFTLDGSIYSSADVYIEGFCYTGTPVDAAPEIRRLLTWLNDQTTVTDGSGTVGRLALPIGMMGLLSGKPEAGYTNTCILVPANVIIEGQGQGQSVCFAGDNLNKYLWQLNVGSNCTLRRFTTYGNRGFQGVGGYHAIRTGKTDPTLIQSDLTFEDLDIFGSPGYGRGDTGCQFVRVVDRRLNIRGSDSDGRDRKDIGNGNKDNSITECNVSHFGLGDIGSANSIIESLAANPIATASGSPLVVVTSANAGARYPGQIITISGATAVGGLTINGSHAVVSRTSTTWAYDAGSNAASTVAAGGGSAVKVRAPAFSAGDAGIDERGPSVNRGNRVEIPFSGLTGIRFRSGEITNPNGQGGHNSTLSDAIITGRPGEAFPYTTKGIDVQAHRCTLTGCRARGIPVGIDISPAADQVAVSGVVVDDCSYAGIWVQGEGISISSVAASNCDVSIKVNSDLLADEGGLSTDPFTTTSGSKIVAVNHQAHGKIAGTTVTFYSVEAFNGITIGTSSNVYSIANVTTNGYTITVGVNATASGAGGGDHASYIWEGTTHDAKGVKIGELTSVGAVTADIEFGPHSIDGSIANSYGETGLLITGAPVRTRANGNSGKISNTAMAVQSLATSGSKVIALEELGMLWYVPSNASGRVSVTLPTVTLAMVGARINFSVETTFGIRLLATGSPIRIGSVATVANSTTGGLEASTVGASVSLVAVTTSVWQAESSIGAWTLVP